MITKNKINEIFTKYIDNTISLSEYRLVIEPYKWIGKWELLFKRIRKRENLSEEQDKELWEYAVDEAYKILNNLNSYK